MIGKARADQPAVLATDRTTFHHDGIALDASATGDAVVSQQHLVAAQKAVGQSSAVLFDQVAAAVVALKQKSPHQDAADEVAAHREPEELGGDSTLAAVLPASRAGQHRDFVAGAPIMVDLSGAGDVIVHEEKHTGGATQPLVRASQQGTTALASSHSIALTSSGTIEGTEMHVRSAPVHPARTAKGVKYEPHPVLDQPQLPALDVTAPAALAGPAAALVPGSSHQRSVAWHHVNLHGSSFYVMGLIFASVVAGFAAYCIDMQTFVGPQSNKLSLKGRGVLIKS